MTVNLSVGTCVSIFASFLATVRGGQLSFYRLHTICRGYATLNKLRGNGCTAHFIKTEYSLKYINEVSELCSKCSNNSLRNIFSGLHLNLSIFAIFNMGSKVYQWICYECHNSRIQCKVTQYCT